MGIKLKNKQKVNQFRKVRRVARVRAVVSGTPARPRLAVERSLKHMRAQIIDDTTGKTLAAANDGEVKARVSARGGSASGGDGKVALATEVGKILAEKAIKAGIKSVVFDRRSYRYHGRVKALADGARAGGLIF